MKRRYPTTLLLVLITAAAIIVDSCATIYISDGNVKEKIGGTTEQNIGVNDHTTDIVDEKK